MRNVNGHSIYEFGGFVLDVDKLMLYRDEAEISLPPKVVKTLAVLVENRGEILSKDELMEKVWEGSVVEESNLSQYLYLLRKTVGQKPDGNPYIETLRRRGYRFTGNVKARPTADDIATEAAMPRPSLIGREREIDEVISLLSRRDVPMVTVSGIGGVGKTTLARAVADKWTGDREVVFVELAPITDPAFVVTAIASTLGVKESAEESLLDRIKDRLKAGSSLLVLDNFEQVASAAPLLRELVDPETSQVKILVTSRVALHVEKESVYVLPPLQVPHSETLDDISRCESVRLFVERAEAVQPRFELTGENLTAVAGICDRLEGLPLAIELAAARMKLLTPEAVLNRLEKQLDVLRGGSSEAPLRQQTMRQTIAWSFDLLSDREKQVLARLGVFSGGFDLESAESVIGEPADESEVSVLDAIASLVEHNLLAARNAKNGDPRIYLLEVVREFALEILTERRESDNASRSHAEYFQRLGEAAEPQLVAARSAAWLERLETEHDNLRSALAWSRRNDPLIGQKLAGAIWRFWWLHGHIREACEQLGSFLDIPSTDPLVRAKMLTGATFLNRLAGNSECSRRYAEEGVKLSDATGDLRNGALAFNQLGFLALDTGDYSEAQRMFSRGLKKAEALGDIQVLALLNNGLGELSRMKEDYDHAAEFYGRALKYNRDAGDRVRQTTCLINLGATSLMQEDREAAGSFYREGLEISSQMEDMNGTLYCLEGLAGSYWASRDAERSSMIFGAADAGRRANDLLLEPADKIPYERSVDLVRDSLGAESFKVNFANGSKLSLNEAAALAIEKIEHQIRESIPPETHVGGRNIVVQRQGNVLRLVDWSEADKAENDGLVEPATAVDPPSRSFTRAMIAAAAGMVLVLTGVFVYLWLNSNSAEAVTDHAELNSLTLTNGVEVLAAAITPDGMYFAYHEPEGKLNRIWLQQTGHATKREIVPASETIPLAMTFTPDGQYLYFVASDNIGETASLYRIPTLGGPVTKIMSYIQTSVSFSPDGREMVYYRLDKDGARYVIRSSDGSGDERLLYPSTPAYGSSAWSPDGKWIAIARQANPDDHLGGCKLAVVKVETGSLIEFSDEVWDGCARIEWAPDSRGIYMIGTRTGEVMTTRRDQLFYISYPQGKSRKLTSDGNRHHWSSLAVTRDGAVLVVPFNRSSQMWGMDPGGDSSTARQLTTGQADGRSGIAPLADGRVAYISRTGENLNIWVMHADGSEQTQITSNSQPIEELRSGGNGRYLIVSGLMNPPRPHLFRLETNGTGLQQITSGPTQEIDSSVSHDGKWITYDSVTYLADKVEVGLWKQPIDGGERIFLNRNDCQMPHFSPDDKYISCVRAQKDILILSAADGSLVREISLPPIVTINHSINFGARWTPDGKAVVYVVNEKGIANLWTHPIDGSPPKQLTNFTNGSIYHFAYSVDGSRLFLARGNQIRDALLIRPGN